MASVNVVFGNIYHINQYDNVESSSLLWWPTYILLNLDSWAHPQSVFCEVWGGWSGGSCNSICNSFDKFLSSSLHCHTGYKGIFKPFQINFLIYMIAGKWLFYTFIWYVQRTTLYILPCRCWIDIFRFWCISASYYYCTGLHNHVNPFCSLFCWSPKMSQIH